MDELRQAITDGWNAAVSIADFKQQWDSRTLSNQITAIQGQSIVDQAAASAAIEKARAAVALSKAQAGIDTYGLDGQNVAQQLSNYITRSSGSEKIMLALTVVGVAIAALSFMKGRR